MSEQVVYLEQITNTSPGTVAAMAGRLTVYVALSVVPASGSAQPINWHETSRPTQYTIVKYTNVQTGEGSDVQMDEDHDHQVHADEESSMDDD